MPNPPIDPTPGERPNVVWICADDFTPDCCGVYGNKDVRTPHLDRLAARGIRCDRAYCACPLSTPSRQAFWTGRYPRSIGVTLSPTPLPADEVTLPALLRGAGYEVASFGKTHFYAPRTHEFDVCVDIDNYGAWISGINQVAIPREIATYGRWRPFGDHASVWLNSACTPSPCVDAEMFGTYLASRAADFVARPHAAPFFLYVSFHETHSPFRFPIEFRGRHDPQSLRVPEPGPADGPQTPLVFRDLTHREKQGIQAAYLTCTEFMDKNVGLVLDALDGSPHANKTLVIFTSDHGYLLGQHGRFEKHCCYEAAIRTALLMRLPGLIREGCTTDALIELIDLFPTVTELCGIKPPANVHGRSFVSLLRGETDCHRERVFVEYADNAEAMVRTSRWKLIYSSGERLRDDGYDADLPTGEPSVQLFDLDNDPDEFHNLATDRKCAELVRNMTAELAEHLDHTARDARLSSHSTYRPSAIEDCSLSPPEFDRLWR